MPHIPSLLILVALASLAACTTDNEPAETTTTSTPAGPTLPTPTTIGTAAIDAELDALLTQFGVTESETDCIRETLRADPDLYATDQTDIDQPAFLRGALSAVIDCGGRDNLTDQLINSSPAPLPDDLATCIQDQLRLITDDELINALTGDPTAMATLDQALTSTCGTPPTR